MHFIQKTTSNTRLRCFRPLFLLYREPNEFSIVSFPGGLHAIFIRSAQSAERVYKQTITNLGWKQTVSIGTQRGREGINRWSYEGCRKLSVGVAALIYSEPKYWGRSFSTTCKWIKKTRSVSVPEYKSCSVTAALKFCLSVNYRPEIWSDNTNVLLYLP